MKIFFADNLVPVIVVTRHLVHAASLRLDRQKETHALEMPAP
jgi:hypothetical protein